MGGLFGLFHPPTERERELLRLRIDRLEIAAGSIRRAQRAFARVRDAGAYLPDRLRLRDGYVYLSTPSRGGSDRCLPPRDERPPLTQIMSPRGAALRFHLMALADAQVAVRAGQHPSNRHPLRPTRDAVGWTDLLASPATYAGSGRVHMTEADKRLRQVQSALRTLSGADLVTLPQSGQSWGKYEQFVLLDEARPRRRADGPLPYLVPKKVEAFFSVPFEFITHGWVHVLEDTEIALLFMVACGLGSVEAGQVAVPAEVRSRRYGIGRDAFGAHRRLEQFGLIRVTEVRRHDDGRAVDYGTEGAVPHRMELMLDGFGADALETVLKSLTERASM